MLFSSNSTFLNSLLTKLFIQNPLTFIGYTLPSKYRIRIQKVLQLPFTSVNDQKMLQFHAGYILHRNYTVFRGLEEKMLELRKHF
jgi:hypothetical protein